MKLLRKYLEICNLYSFLTKFQKKKKININHRIYSLRNVEILN